MRGISEVGGKVMDSSFGSSIGQSLVVGIIILIIIAFSLGALVTWGLPKLWLFIKPIIHAITA